MSPVSAQLHPAKWTSPTYRISCRLPDMSRITSGLPDLRSALNRRHGGGIICQRQTYCGIFLPTRWTDRADCRWRPTSNGFKATSSGIGSRVERLGLQHSDIILTTARGVHASPLAEFVFHALIGHWKQHPRIQADQKRRHWERYCGEELAGKTLAIIGVGEVGRRIIQIGLAFGMRVVALARPGSARTAADLAVDTLFRSDDLHAMLSCADALVLIIPHTAETEGMIDRAAIAALKPGAVLVNIARGQVIDEQAMIDALRTGHIAFAALDVFAVEPLPISSPLWDLPNVLVSPHSASTATTENGKITDIFCRNLKCFLEGRMSEMANMYDRSRSY